MYMGRITEAKNEWFNATHHGWGSQLRPSKDDEISLPRIRSIGDRLARHCDELMKEVERLEEEISQMKLAERRRSWQ